MVQNGANRFGADHMGTGIFGATGLRARLAHFALGLMLVNGAIAPALATPSLVVDVESGTVLSQQDANAPWYPASLTKLMTVYVALRAVQDGHLTLDTPLKVSPRATHVPPSKMGFRPGSEVTLDNALKMLMVKSANDIAIVIAEAIAGSVEHFADRMNEEAAHLGMQESHFVNPNGLPSSRHISSARDFAVLARALLREFPEHADLYGIGALSLGGRTIPTHNGMLGRYPGADGMKTGFTCAAGFNIVATATQRGRRLIAVVMGEASAKARTQKAAELLDAGFASSRGTSLESIERGSGAPPDMHATACSRKTKDGTWVGEIEDFSAPIAQVRMPWDTGPAQSANMAALPRPVFDPVPVYLGRAQSWSGAVLSAANPAIKTAPASATSFAPLPKAAAHAQPLASPKAVPAAPEPAGAPALEPAEAEAISPLQPDPQANPMALAGALTSQPAKASAAKTSAPKAPPAKGAAAKVAASKPADKAKAPGKPAPKAAPAQAAHPAKPQPKPAKKLKPVTKVIDE